jgi:dihydropteroate synthase
MDKSAHIINQLCKTKPRPLVMGILNVTPDSFSDGNNYFALSKAVEYAKYLINQGADIIDVGGESTRPGAREVSLEQELDRVIPVIKAIRTFSDIVVSIDTRKSVVAEQAIHAGADIINDVSALRSDPDMVTVLQQHADTGIILMHMLGQPATMQQNPAYADVIEEILDFMRERINYCINNQILQYRLFVDPGIGFGKSLEHNLSILANLKRFKHLDIPLVLGASRKRFINEIIPSEASDRLGGSLAATSAALEAGVDVIRVHDVKEHIQYLKVIRAIQTA